MKTISLSQGKQAIVSDEDYEYLNAHKWTASRAGDNFYAVRKVNQRLVLMHREVKRAKYGDFVDHKNHNTLDNRKENLRLCSWEQNCRNTRRRKDNSSGFKGVGFHRRTGKWRARIVINGKQKEIGEYATAEDAAKAYDQQAILHHKEFAVLNFRKG